MRALKAFMARWQPAAKAEAETAGGGFVLPRFLRKPARLLMRRDWQVPRYVGLKGIAALFMSTAVAGVLIGGHVGDVVGTVTAWSGLSIDAVKITGQSETSELDVLDKLAIGKMTSLVTFDVEAARERVEQIPWVEQATLRKFYPDTLQVVIRERTPFAIWQHDQVFSLIDKTGRVIEDQVGDNFVNLPMVVGAKANLRADEFATLIDGFPTLKPRVKAGVLIFDRRWNVILNNGIEAMLPEKDPEAALVQLVALDDESGLLNREIAAVDLRLSDRLVVRLTDRGETAWQAILKDRAKNAKRGKANT